MNLSEILSQIPRLSSEERRLLQAALEAAEQSETRRHSLLELEGRGRRAADQEDAQDYVNRLREEWDKRP